jgi:hypothetical protein
MILIGGREYRKKILTEFIQNALVIHVAGIPGKVRRRD